MAFPYMLYTAATLLIALIFTLLAYVANREQHYIFAAMLAGGAWLFAGIGVVLLWAWW
jgi:hypothetical protein